MKEFSFKNIILQKGENDEITTNELTFFFKESIACLFNCKSRQNDFISVQWIITLR